MKAVYRCAAKALRPALRHPFPGRWRVFGAAINHSRWAEHWFGAPLRWTRCKNTGFQIPCDLSVFSGRIAWYFRRWYEIDTQSAIMTLLPEGGTFIDIGGNVGMASLSAAASIGMRGRLIAFEPNPDVAKIHAEAMRRNGLSAISTLYNAAVADREGHMDLFVPHSNHGEASLATHFTNRDGRTVSVKVTNATQLRDLDRIDLVKIDVEGFELAVLTAIQPALEQFRPPVITELMDEHLSRAGSSSAAIIELMAKLGYRGFALHIRDVDAVHQNAAISTLDLHGQPAGCNVLWVPESEAARVLALHFRPLKK